jgi:hypothetical protein
MKIAKCMIKAFVFLFFFYSALYQLVWLPWTLQRLVHERVHVGERWVFNPDSPFEEQFEVQVVAVSRGYVLYKYTSNGGTDSEKETTFSEIFTRREK